MLECKTKEQKKVFYKLDGGLSIRLSVLECDNYACQECLKQGIALSVKKVLSIKSENIL
ncbi:5-methylcytosine-specific restriction endonuclease McrA [Metabacillus crassostreae]|uniref:hypothetical protein n=1 Tax=Metabacillus crassostreae TaxID=929098 RepID=UPI00195C0192|nr:hypothetical protein [Metabacillus crassostreae]MBM7606003.1 5-methylcytosine-specific restriction endonuclease McrA [Metabacillus crassostreae]